MPLATTTLAAVINKVTDVLHAAVPPRHGDKPFFRAHPELPLEDWATVSPGDEVFRAFEVVRAGPREDPGVMDPAAAYVTRQLTVRVAYPAKLVGLYGRDDLDDLEDLMEEDATKIRDAIFSPGNLIAGCNGMVPVIDEPTRAGPVWFQTLTVNVHLFVAQTLT